MSFAESAVLAATPSLDPADVLGALVNYAMLSTLAGLAALGFAIGVAALLDDRPLRQVFDFSNIAGRLAGRGRPVMR